MWWGRWGPACSCLSHAGHLWTPLCVSVTQTAARWHPIWGCLPQSFMAHCSVGSRNKTPQRGARAIPNLLLPEQAQQPLPTRQRVCEQHDGLGWAGGLCAQRKPEAGVCEAGVCAAYPRQAPQAAQVLSLLLVGAPRQQQLGQTLTHREAVFCRCNRPLPSPLKHSVQACCSPGAARN